jgi:ParB-like chromosome segregation protein Spo0J
MNLSELSAEIKKTVDESQDKTEVIGILQKLLHEISPMREQPINHVMWVPVEMVEPNNYNPNSVAGKEMSLLYVSIKQDGYTQPIVTIWDANKNKFVIVDGFHRYFIGKNKADIRERNKGLLPIVCIQKSINERMAATVRHNRARGEHSISGMSNLVFNMLNNGWSDADICNHLGLEAEEIIKLKHITGFSKLFKDAEYRKAWESKHQIALRLKHDQQTRP